MTQDEARHWLQQQIATGFVNPRTYEHSCREVVVYYQANLEEQHLIAQALAEVIGEYEWATFEQIESAAYLVVNLESLEALQKLVASVGNLSDPSGEFATAAIAAIRSFPGNGAIRDLFLAPLFRWLKVESVAHLAFEALCDLTPSDMGGYFSAFLYYHRGNPQVLQKALTHLYFYKGDTNQGAILVSSVVASFPSLLDAIKSHPFLPDTFKDTVGTGLVPATGKRIPRETSRPASKLLPFGGRGKRAA